MSMSAEECIKMIEKQVEFALLGFVAEIEELAEDLKESDSLAESAETLVQIKNAVDAMEDMFGQLEDVRAEAEMITEMEKRAISLELGDARAEETK